MSVTLLPANPSELARSMRRAVYVSPAELLDNPRNLRTNLSDLDDLKASVEVLGVLCPLVVVASDPTIDNSPYMIIIGHRRKYAAIELGLAEVPCWIAENEDEAVKIAAQLAENGHRVGLSATEEAEGFHQLMLMDWSVEKISAVRHLPVAEVRKTLRLRELPQQARQAADSGQITLDDAAKIAEFADEPAALARILKASGTWGIQHAISSEKAKKAFATAKERLRAQLVLDGVKVGAKPKSFPAGPEKPVQVLVDSEGNRLDPEVVKTWPGFAAFIEKDGTHNAQAVIYCVDPDKHGYTVARPSYAGSHVSEAEQASRDAEAAAKAEYLNALDVAAPVRRDFYKKSYGSAKAAKRLFVEALRSTVTSQDLPLYDTWDDLYTGLGGVSDGEVLAAAGEDRLRRCLVATWICRHEQNLTMATIDRSWDMDHDAALWWLAQLVTDGYTLSEAEQQLYRELSGEQPSGEADDSDGEREVQGGERAGAPADGDVEEALHELTAADPVAAA